MYKGVFAIIKVITCMLQITHTAAVNIINIIIICT